MIDPRPIADVFGLVAACLGVAMLVPMLVDPHFGSPDGLVFLSTATISLGIGGALAGATANRTGQGPTIQQTFLLTTPVWIALPLFAAVRAQVRAIHVPHGVFTPRSRGRPLAEDILWSVMARLVMFVVTLGVLSGTLGTGGLDRRTAVSGAAAALANVGPGLGDTIGPVGNFATINDAASWLLAAAMLVGLLEVLSACVLFTLRVWRN